MRKDRDAGKGQKTSSVLVDESHRQFKNPTGRSGEGEARRIKKGQSQRHNSCRRLGVLNLNQSQLSGALVTGLNSKWSKWPRRLLCPLM